MFEIVKKDKKTKARIGILRTAHGIIETPAYVVVGTNASVRCLNSDDVKKTKSQVIIVNTYHMWLALGDENLARFKGLHRIMHWNKPLMTDSGGFQVFSLGFAREHGTGKIIRKHRAGKKENLVRITDNGAYFVDNGRELYLDARRSIYIQEKLGADIIFAFDECTSPKHNYEYNKKALERTHRWAKLSLEVKKSNQLIFGIVQGGPYKDLREKSAKFISGLGFDGYGIGGSFGSSFGSTKKQTFQELFWSVPYLPENKPRHLLGIGKVDDLFIGVEQGIDLFDCVVPTREARHGTLWASRGRFNILRNRYKNDNKPIDANCRCYVCINKGYSRQYIHNLFKSKDPEAGRLATIHNIFFFNNLMARIRESINQGNFLFLKKKILELFNS